MDSRTRSRFEPGERAPSARRPVAPSAWRREASCLVWAALAQAAACGTWRLVQLRSRWRSINSSDGKVFALSLHRRDLSLKFTLGGCLSAWNRLLTSMGGSPYQHDFIYQSLCDPQSPAHPQRQGLQRQRDRNRSSEGNGQTV